MINTIKQLDRLIQKAIELSVSDVHFEVFEASMRITFRRHKNSLETVLTKDIGIFFELKKLSRFDPTYLGAQTGTFSWIIQEKEFRFRFAGIETSTHTSAVLRILNVHDILTITDITSDTHTISKLSNALDSSGGLVLFVGKTGSGKSTTLFHSLRFLGKGMVYTLENPIERLEQSWVQIESKNFEEGVTQLLRHDPDILVIGEVRSKKDLEVLIRASLSGHKVLTTMHAGSIHQAIRRMVDLGVSMYDLESLIHTIVYQEMNLVDEKVVINFEIKNFKELEGYFKT